MSLAKMNQFNSLLTTASGQMSTLSQLRVMIFIYEHDECAISDMAEHLKIEVDAIRKIINALQANKLIKSKYDKGTRGRARRCSITPKGKKLVEITL